MSFRLILEMDPPRQPDLGKALRQLDLFRPVAGAILIPDNHLGAPAMSSLALSIEARNRGLTPIAAINARDRNHLRLESDLLTLRAYGVDEVLLLYGDEVDRGRSALTVREMLERTSGEGLRAGVVASVGKPLGWRAGADFLVTKLALGSFEARRWRESSGFSGPVYCGVLALSDGALARRVARNIPDLEPPGGFFQALDDDDEAGFALALGALDELEASGINGAHIVVPARRRRFVELLAAWTQSRSPAGLATVAEAVETGHSSRSREDRHGASPVAAKGGGWRSLR